MSTEFIQFFETDPDIDTASLDRPTYQDLQDNAEAGIVRRAMTRYFVPRNYEKSIRRHQRLGSPIVRKVVMGTVGRIAPPGTGGNYRLDHRRSRIESATNFAFRGSVFNEAVHTVAAAPATVNVANSIIENSYSYDTLAGVLGAGINLALVALQRYNRARMVKRVDEELQAGAGYNPSYRSWTGIDARAVDNYYANLHDEPQAIGKLLDTEAIASE